MKTKYKILTVVLLLEFIFLKFLQIQNFQLHNSSFLTFIIATVLLFPIYALFYNLARDAKKLGKKFFLIVFFGIQLFVMSW